MLWYIYQMIKTAINYIIWPAPKKVGQIPAKLRNQVWVKYHKEQNQGVCYVCNKEIERFNNGWHCSHVVSKIKGGPNSVENLRTCCSFCNLSMRDRNMYAYIKDKKMLGPGKKNVANYFKKHPDQINDVRTNNYGK